MARLWRRRGVWCGVMNAVMGGTLEKIVEGWKRLEEVGKG